MYGHVQLVLPNKPVSKIDIINDAKRPCISVFKVVLFLRDLLMREEIKNECGILNLDSYSGHRCHWVLWCKESMKRIDFDSYGVHPHKRIDYLSHLTYILQQRTS